MNSDYAKKTFSKPEYLSERRLATVPESYFSLGNLGKKEFAKFVYERELLRNVVTFDKYSKSEDFKYRVDRLKLMSATLPKEVPVEVIAYEEFLRDNALLNIKNIPFMFKDSNGFAKQIIETVGKYPELAKKYPVLNSFFINTRQGVTNLKLSELIMDGDTANEYHENISDLSDPTVEKVSDYVDNAYISKLFSILPVFAFIQSGQGARGQINLGKVMPTTNLSNILSTAVNYTLNNILNDSALSSKYLGTYLNYFDQMYAKPSENVLPEDVSTIKPIFKNYYKDSTTEEEKKEKKKETKKKFLTTAEYNSDVLLYDSTVSLEEFRSKIKEYLGPKTGTESTVAKSSEYTNHSGGAYGGDTYWDQIGREFGVTDQRHYKDAGNANLSQKLKNAGVKATVLTKEQMDRARTEVERLLGKKYPDNTEGNLQVRNYYQVANADAVFAIAKLSSDKTSVSGGTNTAVQLSIEMNKPTYVWDITTEGWYKYNGDTFEVTEIPTLTKNFAGVGSRDIENYNVKDKETGEWKPRKQYLGVKKEQAAKEAIRNVYEKTFAKTAAKPSTSVKPRIDLSREWKGDLESRPVYTADGINTMRTSSAKPNEHFGNPFSESGYAGTIKVASIGAAVIAYKEWLLGTNHKDVKPQQKQWILDQINQGKLDEATLLYAGKLEARGQGMHPTALAEVVEKLRSTTQPVTKEVQSYGSVIVMSNSSDKYDTYNASFNGNRYNSTVIKDMFVNKEILADAIRAVITKKKSFTSKTIPGDFLTDDTYDSNVQNIDKLINKLIEDRDVHKRRIYFDSKGIGNTLLGYAGDEKLTEENLVAGNAPAPKTFVYLSKRLYEEFGYINPGLFEMNALIEEGNILKAQVLEKQTVTDEMVREKLRECFKSLLES